MAMASASTASSEPVAPLAKVQAHHMVDLHLGGVAHADDRLLHRIGGVFPTAGGLRGHKQGDGACSLSVAGILG